MLDNIYFPQYDTKPQDFSLAIRDYPSIPLWFNLTRSGSTC